MDMIERSDLAPSVSATAAESAPAPARFLGWLALVLAVFAIFSALLAVGQAFFYNPTSGAAHVDQAGSSDPKALPAPALGNASVVNPKAAPAPAPDQLPAKGTNSPAAAARQQ